MSALKASRLTKSGQDAAQLGLFDACDDERPRDIPLPTASVRTIGLADNSVFRLKLRSTKRVRRSLPPKSASPRLITEKDLPSYPEQEVAAVERLVAGIKSDRALLGYNDVRAHFGVSKATANRRMKEGLVPGVRITAGVVMRDGGVRRFSREQVKWLVLAVRFGKEALD
ncbi:MAG: hypothetical protein WAU68_14950 [Vitreimonas sp.]